MMTPQLYHSPSAIRLGAASVVVEADGDIVLTPLAGRSITLGGAVTLSGAIDMANNVITNIGAAGTDFTATGGLTLAGRLIANVNGAVSAPGGLLDGTWFTDGSATTTKPHLLIEPTGTNSTGWSTSGTGLGINAAAGFTGNILDIQTNGVTVFSVIYNTVTSPWVQIDASRIWGKAGTFNLGPLGTAMTGAAGAWSMTAAAVSGGATLLTLTTPAHTAVIAEVIDLSYAAHTMTITGSYATQRFVNWASPTITAASALTITEVIAHEINGPLPAGSAIFTDSVALNLPTYATNGTTASGLRIAAPSGASSNYAINVTSGTSLFTNILMANGSHFQDLNAGTVRNIFLVQSGTPNVVFDNTNNLQFTTAANGIGYRISGTDRASIVGTTNGYGVQINAAAVAGGESAFIINQAAHTAVVAEQPALSIVTQTITLADTTTIAEYAWAKIAAPTFAGVAAGGAEVITDAATLLITGAPVQGSNITLTSSWGLWNKGTSRLGGSITLDDTVNIVVNATTGTKVGTATTQKLGFYNATPIVQGLAVADASGGATVDAEARTAINSLLARIRSTGLIAT